MDFLHYVDCSEEATLGEDADERLRRLHRKVCNIKNDRQMEVSYMKAEERDRLIREEGKREGLIQLIRKNVEKGKEKKKLVSS